MTKLITFKPVPIPEFAKANLLKLADYLEGPLKANFGMANFCDYHTDSSLMTECGTVGCAAGHGPYAGIPKHLGENWIDYINRVFLPTVNRADRGIITIAKDYIFGGLWATVDNTPQGAAARIRHIVSKGLPDDWRQQMFYNGRLSYLQ